MKLGLNKYHDKRKILSDLIHTKYVLKCFWFVDKQKNPFMDKFINYWWLYDMSSATPI